MIGKFLIAATIVLGAGASGIAQADTLAGRCYAAEAGNLDGKVVHGHTLRCAKGTWSTLGKGADTSDVNSFVTIYNWSGTSKDDKVEMLFRPRKSSECLAAVTQPNGRADVFTGKVCDTDYKNWMNVKILSQNGFHAATGQLATTTKLSNFTSIYKLGSELGKSGDASYYLIGVFVEDK